MSLSSISQRIRSVQQDASRIQQRIADISRDEARVSRNVAEAQRRLSRATNPSQADSAAREIERYQGEFARLAEALKARGHNIWYDEFALKVGDSLRRSIDRGLSCSRFGIVVLSPLFFAKNWTQYELDGLVAKEVAGQKVILPLWHRVSKDDVMQYSPTLADRVALNTAMYAVKELADRLHEVLKDEEAAASPAGVVNSPREAPQANFEVQKEL
jgi:hypothetical protein